MNPENIELLRTETRSLPCKLTQDELRERGDRLAETVTDISSEERRQVDTKAQMKARLAELDARKVQLSIIIGRREEDRDVTVDQYSDFNRFVVETVRRDTGETVYTRPMSEEERQRPLPLR